ncbi:MAG: hypothetical protein LCH87_05960 [Actinobacteria bacterium]|jgi:hypothetical protein|uniref:hypothetical protein n=1 Tax=Propionicimonas sp. T2.31MG-18 TaxID=3157620 RepID=UPI0035EE19A2|nr:hypothetical protein [Actinomycetota bacterium]
MGKRLFWFAVGVGLTALVVIKGREYYERFTPKGVADQLEKTREGLIDRVGEFLSTMGDAMDTRESELREALGLDE